MPIAQSPKMVTFLGYQTVAEYKERFGHLLRRIHSDVDLGALLCVLPEAERLGVVAHYYTELAQVCAEYAVTREQLEIARHYLDRAANKGTVNADTWLHVYQKSEPYMSPGNHVGLLKNLMTHYHDCISPQDQCRLVIPILEYYRDVHQLSPVLPHITAIEPHIAFAPRQVQKDILTTLKAMGLHEEAIELCDAILAHDPQHVSALRFKIDLCEQRGDNITCLNAYEDLHALWLTRGRQDKALDVSASMVRLDPTNPSYWDLWVKNVEATGRWQEAEVLLEDVRYHNITNIAFHKMAANIYKHSGNTTWYRQELTLWAGLDMNAVEPHVQLGISHKKDGRYDRAKRSFQSVLAREPEHEDARKGLAISLLKLQEDKEAESLCDAWLSQSPNNPEAQFYGGLANYRQGKHDKAQRLLESAIDQGHSTDWTLYFFGKSCVDKPHVSRMSKALSCAEQLVDRQPDRASYRGLLGDVLGWHGRIGDAQNAYQQALALDPTNQYYHIMSQGLGASRAA